jgi:hypothetical protein
LTSQHPFTVIIGNKGEPFLHASKTDAVGALPNVSAPLELKGHFPLSLENQCASSIKTDSKADD